jgi:predicted dinucleotide-binding enzyme
MHLALIGSGMMGSALGHLWARTGHLIHYSSRHPEALHALVARTPGSCAEPVEAAARAGEALFLGVPFGAMADLAPRLAPLVTGKLVLDAGNIIPVREGPLAAAIKATGTGSGSHTASLLPGARVVKAFNTVNWKSLQSQAHREGARLAVPLAGDDARALEEAAALVREAGFEPVVVPGGMAASARLDFGSAVWNTNFTAAEVRAALGLEGR